MTQPTPRRGRVHPTPQLSRTYEMSLIQEGWATLEALHRFRYLTSWQVAKLLFLGRPNLAGSPRGIDAARKAANERCLRRLKDRQLVETRQAILKSGANYLRREYNVLTEAGHQLLRDQVQARGETLQIWDPDRSEIAPEALAHALLINDVAVAFVRSCEHHGWNVLAWLDDLAAVAARGEAGFGRCIPDAVAVVTAGPAQAVYLIEVDRGTEPVNSSAFNAWASKMARYRQYLSEGYPTDPFFAGQPAPLLLAITTSDTRLAHLLEATAATGPADHTWLTRAAWLEPPYDGLGTIWQRPTRGAQFFSLLDEMALRAAYPSA